MSTQAATKPAKAKPTLAAGRTSRSAMGQGPMKKYDRSAEDMGNMVELGHVNVTVPDQHLATLFYVSGLGLTRDAYLMTGVENMWINVGRGQFHLPTRGQQVLRGITGLVLPSLDALRQRLKMVEDRLAGTKFAWTDRGDHIDTICPWGNHIRVHEAGPRFGRMRLGMPYVEFPVPKGTMAGIKRFYDEIFHARTAIDKDSNGRFLKVWSGDGQFIHFRETSQKLPDFDGHHIQVTLADFSGPHKKLKDRGLITEESDQWQYRFKDIVDLDTGKLLFTIEHEVRSMTHPMFNRPLMNRNPDMNNRNFRPGHDSANWAALD